MTTRRNKRSYTIADNLASTGSEGNRRSFNRDSYVSGTVKPASMPYSADEVPNPGSVDAIRYSKIRKSRKRKRRLVAVLIGVLTVLLLGVGSAFAYINYLNNQMNDGLTQDLLSALVPTDSSSDPFYMLLLGVDKSEDRDASGEFDGSYRCDTMILCRVDPKNKQVSMVSMPRDLQIQNMGATSDNPVGYGTQKLNAAYTFGGPALCVKTVADISGISISHYVEVDFDGFTAAVDAVGGVEVDVSVEIDDPHTGVYVPAGKNTLNGEQALSVCRSRHTYDNLGDGDALRTAYQRQVISALAAKVLKSDVGTIVNTVNSLVSYVNTDFDVNSLLGLAKSLQGIDSSKIYTASVPKTSQYVDGVWYDFVYMDQWKEMVNRMNQGLPPAETEIDPATGIVISSGGDGGETDFSSTTASSPAHASASIAVRNGTETSGIAAAAVDKLKNFGYSNISAGNANSSDYDKSIVIYDDDTYKRDAEIIAAQLGFNQVVKNDGSYIVSSSVLVVLGDDYASQQQ